MIDFRIRSTQKRRMCSCPHLKDFKKADGFKVFRKVHAHFVCCGSREARKRKVHMLVNFRSRSELARTSIGCILFSYFYLSFSQASLCHCHECGTYSSRLHSCLMCVYFGCYTGNRHIHHHAKSTGHSLGTERGTKKNEKMILWCSIPSFVAFSFCNFVLPFPALDLTHGVIYCFVCRDNVYDLDLEKIRVEQASRAWKALGKIKA